MATFNLRDLSLGTMYDPASAGRIREAGYVAVCYAVYGYGGWERGDIISRHHSVKAAIRAVGGADRRAWREVPPAGPF